MNINDKSLEKEVINIEENPTYDENEGNSNEEVGSDDLYENYKITSDDIDNKNKQMYPSDCYSFLSLYGPIKTPGKLCILFHSRSTERFLYTMRYWLNLRF